MQLLINNLKQPLTDMPELPELETVRRLAAKRLKLSPGEIGRLSLVKKSVDARDKNDILLVYSAAVELMNAGKCSRFSGIKDVEPAEEDLFCKKDYFSGFPYGSERLGGRPAIIGSGPAGLFAGLILAEHGYKPLILERGYDVDRRSAAVGRLFAQGELDERSNIQFGEGGAGTFSDGKLTTRIKDPRSRIVLEKLMEAGAPAEIGYLNKPHIGTDILRSVLKNMRKRIGGLGGEIRFDARVTDIAVENGTAKAVLVNGSESIAADVVIAALGHSARDTYEMLYRRGVKIIPKPFSIGVRIEHLQEMINESQYGRFAGHPALGAADYLLTFKSGVTGRAAYSFCMCPGGMVVAAASESGMVVTNGMSEYRRDGENANSALVVSVTPGDFPSAHPLAGVEFQRAWEKKAYELGGGGFHAPAQLLNDFINGRASRGIGAVKPSYMPGIRLADLNQCLPRYVALTMREALEDFDRKIRGFGGADAVLTGVETRTSAPLRIVRKEDMESESTRNLYPIGEGAGYAGGIVSAAVDGIKAAEAVMKKYRSPGSYS